MLSSLCAVVILVLILVLVMPMMVRWEMPMMVTGWSGGSSKMGIDVVRGAAHRNMGHAEPLFILIFILWLPLVQIVEMQGQ